ncbi:MAG: hypothetical protein U1D30_06755 [Planctomycetota bacterium]
MKVLRLHGVHCSIFANEAERDGEPITYHKVSLARVYRDGKEFKSTSSLSRDDLPTAAFLLEQAYAFIADTELVDRESDDE